MATRSIIALYCTLVLVVGSLPPAPARAAGSDPAKLVDAGVNLYYEGRYAKSLQILEQALDSGKLSGPRRSAALQYQAFCQIALGQKGAAREIFARLLDEQPDFRLPAGTPPKIVELFEAVRAERAPPPALPAIQHAPSSGVAAGASLEVLAEVDHLPPGGGLVVRYRHDRRAPFGRLPMTPRTDGRHAATVPAPLTGGAMIEYFLEATDGEGRVRANLGDSSEPFQVTVASAPPPPPVSEEKSSGSTWWIWTLVGVAVAGAAVGIGVGLTAGSEATGSARVRIEVVP